VPIGIFFIMLVLMAFILYLAVLGDRKYRRLDHAHDAEKQKNIKEKHYHMGSRLSKPVNWRVLLSHEIQRHLPDQKTEAIIRYRQLTGADVQDATQTIAYQPGQAGSSPQALSGADRH
jgi:hypothetical protein